MPLCDGWGEWTVTELLSLLIGGCVLNSDICILLSCLFLVLFFLVVRRIYPRELFLWVEFPAEVILTLNPSEPLVLADCRNLDRSAHCWRSRTKPGELYGHVYHELR